MCDISSLYDGLVCSNEKCLSFIEFLSSIAQIAFGVAAVWIAIQQWKISHNKSKFELYEKRYEAYKSLKTYLSSVLQSGKVETQALVSFRWKHEEHYFLFDQDIHDYIKLIYEKSLEFRSFENRLWGANSIPPGDERSKLVEEQSNILEWLLAQIDGSKIKFKRYLKIS